MRAFTLAARSLVLLVVASGHSVAQSPPPAPSVTVGTDPLKVLQFHWLPVPGAIHYVLQYKPDASAAYQPYGNPILAPRTRASLTIPVHAFDWVDARFKVAACNSAGCQDSAEIPVQDLMLGSIGYFKASNPDAGDGFGAQLHLSQDGNTLVVSAFEASNATGVNGNQSDNSSTISGAVYVFRRIGAGWRQEAYLKPDLNHSYQYFGVTHGQSRPISVSANGSLIAVGAPAEEVGGVAVAGAVYLFARATDGTWSQSHKLHAPSVQFGDYFGMSVDLDYSGTRLKVLANGPYASPGRALGTTRVYVLSDSGWVLAPYSTWISEQEQFCTSQMSGNGATIAHICTGGLTSPQLKTSRRIGDYWMGVSGFQLPDVLSQFPAVSGNGIRAAVTVRHPETGDNRVVVLREQWQFNQWTVDEYLDPPPGAVTEMRTWGSSLAFNHNGTILAIGDYASVNGGAGVMDAPLPSPAPPPTNQYGGVYIYQRGESGWSLLKVVKSPSPAHDDLFGQGIALSGNGLTLAVGAIGEDSAARGIDGNQANNSKGFSGAVYLY